MGWVVQRGHCRELKYLEAAEGVKAGRRRMLKKQRVEGAEPWSPAPPIGESGNENLRFIEVTEH